jgi:hypothetical protein
MDNHKGMLFGGISDIMHSPDGPRISSELGRHTNSQFKHKTPRYRAALGVNLRGVESKLSNERH